MNRGLRFLFAFLLATTTVPLFAHPGSAIVLDALHNIYFVDTGSGIWKIDKGGRLTRLPGPAFHWMALDASSRFSDRVMPRIPDGEMRTTGSNPTLILSSDFPVTTGGDGALYYPEPDRDRRVQIIRRTHTGGSSVFATLPAETESGPLRWLNGIAAGPDGSLYYTEDRAVRKVSRQGSLSTVASHVAVPDCSRPPGYEITQQAGPDLRGLAIARDGTVFVAASGCSSLLKITPRGVVTVLMRTASPWSPTAVAISGSDLYVLEYLHTPGDDRRQWIPRVRKVNRSSGHMSIVGTVRR